MEARNYGLARHYDPFLVNTVVGFIGPEYLYNDRRLSAPVSKITLWAS
nr:ethanolamine ammonia lyase large subunit [Salmonella sp. NCTC 7297]